MRLVNYMVYKISGICLIFLAVFIGYFGVERYFSELVNINRKYDNLEEMVSLGISAEMAQNVIEYYSEINNSDSNDEEKLEALRKEMNTKNLIESKSSSTQIEYLKTLKAEEIDGRLLDLLGWLSLALTTIAFGLTLLWRRGDLVNQKENFQEIMRLLEIRNTKAEKELNHLVIRKRNFK